MGEEGGWDRLQAPVGEDRIEHGPMLHEALLASWIYSGDLCATRFSCACQM